MNGEFAEYKARLDDIIDGPWREKSALARYRFPELTPDEQERYFRFHIPDSIKDQNEIDFRESFDQVLEPLQLLELAVASGFLPLDVVSQTAGPALERILESRPAARYLKLYDFVPVRFLAARLGLGREVGSVHPPAVNPDVSVRFSVFLSTHYEFIASPQVRRFTMLIDDFIFEKKIDARFFKKEVAEGRPELTDKQNKVFDEASAGLMEFVEGLGDFFLPVPKAERGYFGLAYSYWLSHFFGLRRTEHGYVARGVSFEDVRISPSLLAPEGVESRLKRFRDRIQTLKSVWDDTRKLLPATS